MKMEKNGFMVHFKEEEKLAIKIVVVLGKQHSNNSNRDGWTP